MSVAYTTICIVMHSWDEEHAKPTKNMHICQRAQPHRLLTVHQVYPHDPGNVLIGHAGAASDDEKNSHPRLS
jgi:hypothetical protein